MTPKAKSLFIHLGLLVSALILTISVAQAQRGGTQNEYQRHNGTRHISVRVERYISHYDAVQVKRVLNANQRDRIVTLYIQAQGNSYRSSINIYDGRRLIRTISLTRFSQNYPVYLPYHVQQLTLSANGAGAYIQSLSADIEVQHHRAPHNPHVIGARVDIRTTGIEEVGVIRAIKRENPQARLHGKKVAAVVLNASSARGRARAQLMINNRAVGVIQMIPMSAQRLVFRLSPRQRNTIGEDIRSIRLEIKGNVKIDRLALRLQPNRF